MSTNSVTKKIIAVGTVYLDNSSSMVVTNFFFFTESVLKVKSFMRISWHCLIGKKCGLENGVRLSGYR